MKYLTANISVKGAQIITVAQPIIARTGDKILIVNGQAHSVLPQNEHIVYEITESAKKAPKLAFDTPKKGARAKSKTGVPAKRAYTKRSDHWTKG